MGITSAWLAVTHFLALTDVSDLLALFVWMCFTLCRVPYWSLSINFTWYCSVLVTMDARLPPSFQVTVATLRSDFLTPKRSRNWYFLSLPRTFLLFISRMYGALKSHQSVHIISCCCTQLISARCFLPRPIPPRWLSNFLRLYAFVGP